MEKSYDLPISDVGFRISDLLSRIWAPAPAIPRSAIRNAQWSWLFQAMDNILR